MPAAAKTARELFLEEIRDGLRELATAPRWEDEARPAQLPPGHPRSLHPSRKDWWIWLNLSGRGTGKTRSGAEFLKLRRAQGYGRRIALIGQTAADVRDVMIEGESGILACSPRWDRPRYEPSKRRLTWPDGCIATAYSGDMPSQTRGPQHDTVWMDEFAKFMKAEEILSNVEMGLRLSANPQMYISTTPVPSKVLREMVEDPDVVVVNESTFANSANLPAKQLDRLRRRYEGTRLGRQELHGELLTDVDGALWTQRMIERDRARRFRVFSGPDDQVGRATWMVYDTKKELWRPVPELVYVVVGVDPAVTSSSTSDDTGIVVVGVGTDDHGYVLEDHTCHLSPDGWAAQVVACFDRWNADVVTAEVNNGGDLVEAVLRSHAPSISYETVHASRGKQIRAQPVASLSEQGRLHLCGAFPTLEDQMSSWIPGDDSPDNLDAMVWAVTKGMLATRGTWAVTTSRGEEDGPRAALDRSDAA